MRYNLKIQYTRYGLTYSTDESPLVYFSDLAGNVFKPEELFLKPDPEAPLADIVCQPANGTYRYRTHFYVSAGKTEHDMLIEAME